MTNVVTCEQLQFAGPHGRLDAELSYTDDSRAVLLICNPHPQMGGTMRNNVVDQLVAHLPSEHLACFRFDYHGVGASEGASVDVAAAMGTFWETGKSPEDEKYIADAQTAFDWLGKNLSLPRLLIGYSFGAYAGITSAPNNLLGIALISPTLAHHSYARADEHTCPLLVIYSDDDFATPQRVTEQWISDRPQDASGLLLSGGEHFYRGLESRICRAIAQFAFSVIGDQTHV